MRPLPVYSQKEKPPKRDIDRLGVFKEDGYMREKEPHIPLDNFIWNEQVHKGKQIMGGAISKAKKDGTDRGYFSPFARTFDGESFSDPLKEYRKRERAKRYKFYAGQFQLPNPGKKLLDSSGNFYGTFGGPVAAFSPLVIDKPSITAVSTRKPNKPFRFKQPSKGDGYGTVDVTISQYPIASQPDPELRPKRKVFERRRIPVWNYYKKHPIYLNKNPYYTKKISLASTNISQGQKPISGKLRFSLEGAIQFRPNGKGKLLGGCKDGCFTNYSKYATAYITEEKKRRRSKSGKLEPIITGAAKSSTYKSVVQANVDKYVNSRTYKTVESVMYIKPKKK